MPPLIKRLGRAEYLLVLDAMRGFTDARTLDTRDEIWLVEHPPVYTQGQAGKPEHLLRETGIPLVRTERGGQITYHGPGQVVAYLMIDLRRRGFKVREFVSAIEAGVIETLAAYNLIGARKAGAPGIYVDIAGELHKIAALGLKIRNYCSYHGVALNVKMDLSPFENINPCGYPGLKTIDMARLGAEGDHAVEVAEVGDCLAQALSGQLDIKSARSEPGG